MADFMSMFFGPLDKSSCVYFLILTIIFFIGLSILIFNEFIFVIQNFNKLNFRMISSGIIILFNIFIAYFVNRLLYTMCSKSLA
jgi:hypothetical protein